MRDPFQYIDMTDSRAYVRFVDKKEDHEYWEERDNYGLRFWISDGVACIFIKKGNDDIVEITLPPRVLDLIHGIATSQVGNLSEADTL